MKHLREIFGILFASLALITCIGREEDPLGPDPNITGNGNGDTNSDYIAAPVKELKYDKNLNELYIMWDKDNTSWEAKDEYIGAEFEFYSLLSGVKTQRVMIPNIDVFGHLEVKKRDYNNEISSLWLSKYRSVVVTQQAGLDEVRYRSIYEDTNGEQQMSDWVNINDQSVQMDKDYSAMTYFMQNVSTPVIVSFSSSSSKPASAIADLVGGGNETTAKERFKEWYYMDVSAMSFDPYNLAFDPYTNLDIHLGDGVGVANAMDYPDHNTGRRINYEASVGNPNSDLWKLPDMQHVMMHEMGHCVEWMPAGSKYTKTDSNGDQHGCDRQGYQEGWPDAVKIANKGYNMNTQIAEYKSAISKPYEDPQDDKKYVWQIDYNTSGAFMSWLRVYNGDFVRLLPWTVLMDELTNAWSLENATRLILSQSYPGKTMKELWEEYVVEVNAFIKDNE